MKKILIGILLMSVLVMNSGCFATIRCVQKYNDKVDARALELKMLEKADGNADGAAIAIDILQAKNLSKGYWSAWKNEAGSMTAAVGIDTLWMGAAYYGGKAIYDAIEDDDNDDARDGKVNVTLENSTGNSVNIIYGDNNDSNNDDNNSATGDSNFDEETN